MMRKLALGIGVGLLVFVAGYQAARSKYTAGETVLRDQLERAVKDVARARLQQEKAREQREVARSQRDEAKAALAAFRVQLSEEEFLADSKTPEKRAIVSIRRAAKIPDPKKAPYPDCLSLFEVSLVPGFDAVDQFGEPLPPQFKVAGLAFCKREKGAAFDLKENGIISVGLVPADKVPPIAKSFQFADGTEDFSLPLYYGFGIRKIEAISDGYEMLEADANPIEVEQARFKEDTAAVQFKGVTRCLVSWQNQLAQQNIAFLVVPVPDKSLVPSAPDMLAPNPPSIRKEFFETISKAGIQHLDILNPLLKARESHELVFYNGSDNHPADGAVQCISFQIGRRLRNLDLPTHLSEVKLVKTRFAIPRELEGWPAELYQHNSIFAEQVIDSKTGSPVDSLAMLRDSPLLLIGDSFIGVPREYGVRGANVVAHLAKATGTIPAVIQRGGGAPQMMKSVAGFSGALKGKKAVIFVFSEGYLFNGEVPGEFDWEIVDLPTN